MTLKVTAARWIVRITIAAFTRATQKANRLRVKEEGNLTRFEPF